MQKTILSLLALCLLAIAPYSLHAQWTKTNGLPGGNVGGFLNYGDTVIVNMGDELYYSSNNGQTWILMPNANGINLLTADTDGHSILGARYAPNTGTRLTISDDFGQSWRPVASADTMLFYEAFFAFGYIYGSDQHGLYRSNDEGATWEYVSHDFFSDIQFDGQRLTGAHYPKIMQSTDGGFSWDVLLSYAGNTIDLLQHENHLFVFMQNASSGCYASNDYGQTWSHYSGTGFNQFYDFVWHNGTIIGLGGSSAKMSLDLGETWMKVPLPQSASYPAFRGVSAGGAFMMGGIYNSESGSILRSTDNGQSWFPADFGINASSGKLRSIENKLYAAGQSGLFQLNADGNNWTRQHLDYTPGPYSQGIITDYLESGDNLLFCNGDSPWVSLDGGQSWVASFYPNITGTEQISEIEAVGETVFGFRNEFDISYFYISENNGLTFQIISPNAELPANIRRLVVDQGKVYAFASNKNIYRSDDAGAHWVVQASNIPTDSLFKQGDGLTFSVAGNVMLLNAGINKENSIFSNDGGQSWTFYNGNSAGLPWSATYLSDMLRIGSYLLLGTKQGVFISQNNGTDWDAWNEGLVHQYVTNMELHDGYLWAGTRDGGIWKRSIAQLNMKPVSGKVFFDQNANNQQDPGEPTLPNIVVQSLATQAFTNTFQDGSYDLLSNLAQEQLKVHPHKPYWTSSPATQTVAVPSNGADFALSLDPAAKDLSVTLTNTSVLRPGFESVYVLSWRNQVPILASNVSIALQYPPDLLDLGSVFPAPSTQSSGSLTWFMGDVAADAQGNIVLKFKVPAITPMNTQICMTTAISPSTNDLFPADNSYEQCATVLSSFDPNDKQAEPADFISPAQLNNDAPITYTIRFQNTGNFPATFVRITDTLMQNFDPASFQLLSSSHLCTWSLRGQGELEFFFNNIQLPPESWDEPCSHGFVKYSVQGKRTLPIGSSLSNTAHIYFDYNTPVITNTTGTQVGTVRTSNLGAQRDITLAPNPVKDVLEIIGVSAANATVKVIDVSGKLILEQKLNPSNKLDVSQLQAGVYFIEILSGAQLVTVKRFIKA